MAPSKARDLIREFLTLYKDSACLWYQDHPLYNNREAREEAYNQLLRQYKSIDGAATLDTVKKKIDNMRCAYKRERRKVLQSIAEGTERHKPILWYYNLLTFIDDMAEGGILDDPSNWNALDDEFDDDHDVSNAKRIKAETDDESCVIVQEVEDGENAARDDPLQYNHEPDDDLLQSHQEAVHYYMHQRRRREQAAGATPACPRRELAPSTEQHRHNAAALAAAMQCQYHSPLRMSTQCRCHGSTQPLFTCRHGSAERRSSTEASSQSRHDDNAQDDKTESFVRTIGLQLKDLNSMQRFIAEKLISEVIFYGRINKLNTRSNISIDE